MSQQLKSELRITKNTESTSVYWEPFDPEDENHYIEYDFETRFVALPTVKEPVPDSAFFGFRTSFKDRLPNGKMQELLVRYPELYSYGVQASIDQKTKALNGYQMSCPLYSSSAPPSDRMKYHIEFMEKKFIPFIRQKMVDMGGAAFGMEEISYGDTKKFRAFTRGKNKETNLTDPNAIPHLQAKLFSRKPTHSKISTPFYFTGHVDSAGQAIRFPDPLVFIRVENEKKGYYVIPMVWITGAYNGATGFCIQYKMSEVDIRPADSTQKRRAPIAKDAEVISQMPAVQAAVPPPQSSTVYASIESTEFHAPDGEHPLGGNPLPDKVVQVPMGK